MENYVGKICPFCNGEIKEGDEIVVCPACGIPHHLGCWAENKGCTTADCPEQYHEAPQPASEEICATSEVVCTNCGSPLGEGQMFCANCGAPKTAPQPHCPNCGEPIAQGQGFCSNCGQKVDVIFNNRIDPYTTTPPAPKKRNVCAILAIVFGAIGFIPFLNFIFLPAAIILAIVGACTCKNRGKGALIAGVIVVSLSLIFSVIWMSADGTFSFGSDFNDMYSDIEDESWCEIASDGSWMELDTNPYNLDDYYVSSAISKIQSVNSELGFSSSVYQEMLETRALDGRQVAYTDDYSVSWSYHPDSGLEVLYKIND